MRAMILAAGLGTRMAPLTQRIPKPALCVLDQPLVVRLIEMLAGQGVESVVVNAHPHADRLREAIATASIPVEISYEARLLGSGGGIRAAVAFHTAEGGPSFVLNADMCVELDIEFLLDGHRRSGNLATLLLRDEPRKRHFGSVGFSEDSNVVRITDQALGSAEEGSGLFTGIHVIAPELFSHMPAGGDFGIVSDVYVPLLMQQGRLGALLQPPEQRWWPVGTPGELLAANLSALSERAGLDGQIVDPDAQIEGELRGPIWVGRGAKIAAGAVAGPDLVVGAGAVLGAGASASSSLLLPGATPPTGDPLERSIAYDREIWRDA